MHAKEHVAGKELPETVRSELTVTLVRTIEEVFAAAFG